MRGKIMLYSLFLCKCMVDLIMNWINETQYIMWDKAVQYYCTLPKYCIKLYLRERDTPSKFNTKIAFQFPNKC